ncbi:MAG: sugar ABC transporter permease, partial [Chloroflexi bacterium]|nr:sugar ABC transporter permease [Chloroflexota bacterium]
MATTSAQAATPSRRLSDRLRSSFVPFAFMTPAAILVILFFFLPVLIILGISLTNMSTATGFQNWRWIGWQNFQKIIAHPDTRIVLWATIQYVALTLAFFNIGMALVIALLSTHVPRRAGFFFRALWLLPRITPSVVYVMMWRYIAAAGPYGILNQHILGPLGLPNQNLVPTYPWLFVILVNGFIGASFGMIIFSSAIESIPKDYMMAALVDGCTIWQRIRYVILPMLRWPLMFVTAYQTLSLLTSFEQILLLTDGSFGTEVWALWSYHRALSNYWGNFQWGF